MTNECTVWRVQLRRGGMAEWSMAAVLKTAVPGRVPGVRIPLPPPHSLRSCGRSERSSGVARFTVAHRAWHESRRPGPSRRDSPSARRERARIPLPPPTVNWLLQIQDLPGRVVAIYRRHQPRCRYASRRFRGCKCPIWVQGSLCGESVRHSLDLRAWEAATDLVRGWESAERSDKSASRAVRVIAQSHCQSSWFPDAIYQHER
jgi:hypothetical protein